MVRRALVPGAVAAAAVFGVGCAVADGGAGVSAALGIAVVVGNFAAHGWLLSRAAAVSLSAVHAVELFGTVARLGLVLLALFGLNTLSWFSPAAFAWAAVPGLIGLLAYETYLVLGKGVGTHLEVPADPIPQRPARSLAGREGV